MEITICFDCFCCLEALKLNNFITMLLSNMSQCWLRMPDDVATCKTLHTTDREQLNVQKVCSTRVQTEYFIAPFTYVVRFLCECAFRRNMTVLIAHSRVP